MLTGKTNIRTAAGAHLLSLALLLLPVFAPTGHAAGCGDSLLLHRPKVSLIVPLGAETAHNPRYFNFCFGAILASRDLGGEGIGMDLNLIDTKEDAFPLDWGLSESDVIIGPVSSEEIAEVLPWLESWQYLVSPMDQQTLSLTDNERVILAVSPNREQTLDMARWISEDALFEGDSLITVIEEGRMYSEDCQEILSALALEGINCLDTTTYAIAGGLKHDEWFSAHVSEFGPAKRIVTASGSEPFQKEVIRATSVQNFFGKQAKLYGTSKTAKVAEVEDLCNANAHISTTYHVDYSNPEVIRFVQAYRALFHIDPDAFAFHGYDTVRFFAHLAAMYGTAWPEYLTQYEKTGLQTDFRFSRSGEGFVNTGIRRVVYSSPLTSMLLR